LSKSTSIKVQTKETGTNFHSRMNLHRLKLGTNIQAQTGRTETTNIMAQTESTSTGLNYKYKGTSQTELTGTGWNYKCKGTNRMAGTGWNHKYKGTDRMNCNRLKPQI
jgi:hypothetical protein